MLSQGLRKGWIFGLVALVACSENPSPKAAPPPMPTVFEVPPAPPTDEGDAPEAAAKGGAMRAEAAAPARRAAPVTAEVQEPPEDVTNYRVPVARSPVRGKATALVTMVIFSDFQCPYCVKVTPTVKQLEAEYGEKLRVVWKNHPLPFHARAEPAAELGLEARAQKGDAGFWAVHDMLFANNGQLDDQDLEDIAKRAGLNAAAAMSSVRQHKHRAQIDDDLDLADDLKADGTPHFFINGRRLMGAQPIAKFRELIDKQLSAASALVQKGTPQAKVYDTLQQGAVDAPPPETVNVPPPTKANPSRGPVGAKVVIQIWSDFQCPFCARVLPTLRDLDAAFPGKLRFVWHNLPLSFHPRAEPAAEVAMEAFAQKGDSGFWSMHDLLFAAQAQPDGLERQNLLTLGQQMGLDVSKLGAALDGRAHQKLIEADEKIAASAGIKGTPGFAINNYKLSGAQPFLKFKKLVLRALREAK